MQSDVSVIASCLYTLMILRIISILFYFFSYYFTFQKVQCPLCKKFVIDLPRHMRGKQHGWPKIKGKFAKLIFNIRRKRANSPTSEVIIQEEYKYCTFPGCKAKVVDLPLHMKACHSKEINNSLIIGAYTEWQNLPNSGGGITDMTIKRQTSQVKKILNDAGIGCVEKLLSERLVESYFLNKLAYKTLEPTTAAIYLFSLINFYRYLSTSHFKEFHRLNPTVFKEPWDIMFSNAQFQTVCALRWAHSYRKLNQLASDNVFNRERPNILTREERRNCKYGSTYEHVLTLLENHQSSKQYSNDTLQLVRNYLILNIFIRNYHRPSVVANLKLDNFLNATTFEAEDKVKKIIDVSEDKVSPEGNSYLIVNEKFYEIMKFYYEHLRTCHGPENEYFFLSKEGKKMVGSLVFVCSSTKSLTCK